MADSRILIQRRRGTPVKGERKCDEEIIYGIHHWRIKIVGGF